MMASQAGTEESRSDVVTVGASADDRAGPIQAHLLLMIACLPVMGLLVIAPVLPDLQRHFADVAGVAFLAPLILSAPAILVVLLSPLVGPASARLGRKRLLIGALLLYSVTATAPLYLDTIGSIIVSRLFVGASEAVLMTVSTILIGDYFEGAARDRYLSMQIVYTSVSAVLFLVGGGYLGEAGWRVPFVAYFMSLLLVLPAIIYLREPRRPALPGPPQAAPVPWKAVLPICVITFFAGACMNVMAVDVGYLVEGVGVMSSTTKGVVAAVNSLGIAVGSFLMAKAGNPIAKIQLSVALLISALGFALVAMSRSLAGVMIGGSSVGVASGFFLGWLLAAVNRPLSFDNRGRAIGTWMSTYFFATIVAPVASAALAVALGGMANAMWVFAALLVALGLGALALPRSA